MYAIRSYYVIDDVLDPDVVLKLEIAGQVVNQTAINGRKFPIDNRYGLGSGSELVIDVDIDLAASQRLSYLLADLGFKPHEGT